MKWPTHWPKALLLLVAVTLEGQSWLNHSMLGVAGAILWSKDRKLEARYVPCKYDALE